MPCGIHQGPPLIKQTHLPLRDAQLIFFVGLRFEKPTFFNTGDFDTLASTPNRSGWLFFVYPLNMHVPLQSPVSIITGDLHWAQQSFEQVVLILLSLEHFSVYKKLTLWTLNQQLLPLSTNDAYPMQRK